MADKIFEPHGSPQGWAASGAIDMNLVGKAFTTTAMLLILRADVTTTTATNYNDYWDRLLSKLTLSGNGRTYFDYSSGRMANHHMRYKLGPAAARRPTVIADSATNSLKQIALLVHFGVAPFRFNPLTGQWFYNPWDLTAGIPPTTRESLSLSGTFGAAAGMGSNVTVNDADLYVNFFGVREESGDRPEAWMPRAFPHWTMESPVTTGGTTTAFGSSLNLPSGDFLRQIVGLLTNGSNDPRDDAVLNSLRLTVARSGRDIFTFGGQAAAAADYKVAEHFSRAFMLPGTPPSDDNSTLGVPSVADSTDEGLFLLPIHAVVKDGVSEPQRVYGMDVRNLNTGDLKLTYGIADASGSAMNLLYEKYQLNPAHPANVGL